MGLQELSSPSQDGRRNTRIWFGGGKKKLFPEPGAFTSQNQHPIACLNSIYKWFAASVRRPVNKHISGFGLLEDQKRGANAGRRKTIDNLLDSDGGFCTGCRNVGRQHQSFSRLQLPRGSFSIKIVLLNAWWLTQDCHRHKRSLSMAWIDVR